MFPTLFFEVICDYSFLEFEKDLPDFRFNEKIRNIFEYYLSPENKVPGIIDLGTEHNFSISINV